ncbi:MAG: hypothetical protein HY021_05355, partial [Burkholderiales bacterium]|nr:hypothetical protein [Burkholderiales bacterium]
MLTPRADCPEPGALHYEFGRGLRLGDSGFTLGGYATLELRDQRAAPLKLKASHASAFVWWEGVDRLKVFGELDLLNASGSESGNSDANDRRVSLERLYADYAFDDALSLRAGKFLTPIGRWNLFHASPLVWTSTDPLVTRSVFPHNVTGLQASGQLPLFGRALGYALYGADGQRWHVDRWQDPFTMVRGGHLGVPLG